MKDFTLAVAQIDSTVGDVEKNLRTHIRFVKEAIARKADVIVFPELSLTGYTIRDLNWDLAFNIRHSSLLKPLQKLSSKITIILGGVEENNNFALYNSAFVVENGVVHSAHKKIYLPTYGMFEEMRYFSQGKTLRTFNSRYAPLGILICEDLWHLSLPYMLAHDGAKLIVAMAASPTRLAGQSETLHNADVNAEHHKTYARLLSLYVVFANRVGIEDGVTFWGGSQIIDPSGESLAKSKLFEEDLITATISDERIRRARRFSRHFIDDSPAFTAEQLGKMILHSK